MIFIKDHVSNFFFFCELVVIPSSGLCFWLFAQRLRNATVSLLTSRSITYIWLNIISEHNSVNIILCRIFANHVIIDDLGCVINIDLCPVDLSPIHYLPIVQKD